MDAETHRKDVERWRARRLARLTAPDGWLTLVGLHWLHEGDNPVGSGALERAGAITLRNGVAILRADPAAGLTHQGSPVDSLVMHDDREGDPTVVHVGTLSFHLINRDGRLAVRVKDAESPAREAFAGIDSYAVDLRWRVEAEFEPAEPPHETPVPNVLGFEETMVVPGALRFEVDGATHRLLAFKETGTRDLFIVFGDRTNEDETYGGGRYLYAAPPKNDRPVVVDFNKTYNPPCVFTAYATCVLPLPENRLPVRIEAGEKRYHG
jgi:uncharacterized protein (DUF1684 family)